MVSPTASSGLPPTCSPGSVRISACWIDGQPYSQFDAAALTVQLPESTARLNVKVTLTPN